MGKSVLAVLAAAIIALLPAASMPLEEAFPEGSPGIRCLAVGMDRFVTEKDTDPCSADNAELMAALLELIPDRQAFIDHYWRPAWEQGLIDLAYPDSPNKPGQTYRLTADGLDQSAQLTVKE